MSQLSLGLVFAIALLFSTENLTRKKILSSEVARKIAHSVIGLIFVISPFFVSMRTVAALGALFTIAALIVRQFNLFQHTRKVDRLSWGEPFFGLGVSIAALLDTSKWIFAAAVLYLAFADAAAALVGQKFGKHRYKIFARTKSIEGTLAFMVVSAIITALLVFVAPAGFRHLWPIIIWLPPIAGLLEAFLPYGLDNLVLPVVVVLVLKFLQR